MNTIYLDESTGKDEVDFRRPSPSMSSFLLNKEPRPRSVTFRETDLTDSPHKDSPHKDSPHHSQHNSRNNSRNNSNRSSRSSWVKYLTVIFIPPKNLISVYCYPSKKYFVGISRHLECPSVNVNSFS